MHDGQEGGAPIPKTPHSNVYALGIEFGYSLSMARVDSGPDGTSSPVLPWPRLAQVCGQFAIELCLRSHSFKCSGRLVLTFGGDRACSLTRQVWCLSKRRKERTTIFNESTIVYNGLQ